MTEPKSRTWQLDPHGHVVPADGQPVGTFTGQEWRVQQWPACPVCGGAGEPQRVDASQITDRFPVFVIGAWECENDCDPRPALRDTEVSPVHNDR